MRAWVASALLVAVAAAGDDARRADLLSGEWERSNRAFDALAAERAEVSVPLLVEALSLDESFLRRRAAQTLAFFGKEAAPAAPALIQALYDDDRLVAVHAMMALDAANASEAVPFVADAVRNLGIRPPAGLQNLRLEAPPVLEGWLGGRALNDPRAAGRLREGLAEKQAAIRAACAQAVGYLGEAGRPFVPLLRDLLRDESFEVCGRAALALATIGGSDADTVGAIAAAWQRKETFVRRNVALALSRIGTPAFPVLSAALGGKDVRARRWAAFAVLSCAVPPTPLVEPLCAALEDPDRTVRLRAVQALGRALGHAAPAVPHLVALLASGDEEIVAAAIDTLGLIGPAAAPATPRLLPYLDGHASAKAICALGAIGSAEAIPFLVEALEKGRMEAAMALGRMGQADALIAATGRADLGVRRAAVGAISNYRIQTPEAVAAMRRLANEDPDPAVRNIAAMYGANAPTRDDSGLEELLAKVRAEKPPFLNAPLVQKLAAKARPATLLALLDDENSSVRRHAAFACAQADWSAEDRPLAALTRLLDDADVRFDVARIVVGFKDATTVEPLLRVLGADQARERREQLAKGIASFVEIPEAVKALDRAELRLGAALVLGQVGPPALEPAAPKLAAMVADPDRNVGSSAIWALARLGSVPHVRDALLSPDRNVASMAAGIVATAPPAVREALVAAAKDDVILRQAVANVCAKAKDVDALVAFARDEDATVRAAAVAGLAKVPEGGPVLLAATRDADRVVRSLAFVGLAQMRPVPEGALPELERLLKTETDPSVLGGAATLARSLGAPAGPLVDGALVSGESRLRLFAVKALAPDLRLAGMLKDKDEEVRVAAAEGLSGNAEALDALVQALGDGSERVASQALRSIGSLRDKAAPAAKVLVARLASGEDRVKGTLLKIGPAAIPALIELPPKKRETLQEILRDLGPPASARLIELLQAEEADTRRKAAWALGLLGRDAEAAVPALTKALGDGGRFVASQAAWALGEIGAGAKSAIPELEKLLKDPATRQAAGDALKKIKR